MDDQLECYVSKSLAAMLQVSRLAGLAPLEFEKKGDKWRIRVSRSWSYYGYVIITAIIITVFAALLMDLQLDPRESVRMPSSTRRVVWITDVGCMLLLSATSVYSAPGLMRAMIATVNHIEKINFDLNIRQYPMAFNKKQIWFFFVWTAVTIILTTVDHVVLLLMEDTKKTPTQSTISDMYMIYYCCYWILQLRQLNFVITTLQVMYCLRRINDCLKNLLRELADRDEHSFISLFNTKLSKATKKKQLKFKVDISVTTDFKKFQPEGTHKTAYYQDAIRRLGLAFGNTCDVVRHVDNAHGLVVLMMLGSFLLHLVCTPYYLITGMFEFSSEENWTAHLVYNAVQFVWCFYHTVNLLMVIEPCHLTQIEIETTCELVSHLMRCTDSVHDPLAMELEIFFRHLFLNQASYSAMHVTSISRSLVATILGSVTTYLVIIIQL
uniref:Gustatory receptor n=1 Tax=Ectropis obliqua TaxID=248899 RepID=A0A1L2BLD2_ECTOB|nr:odorant receptor 1 [Ectropis obliqua]